MKLVSDMYHLNTFNIPKKEGVSKQVNGYATKKPAENAKENGIFSLPSITI